MYTLDDHLVSIPLSPAERQTISQRLVANSIAGETIGEYANANGLKPMRVAQELITLRPADTELKALVKNLERHILRYGTTRITAETVEGDLQNFDKFWRNNDPLGVYQPGDMFYVDPNHPWRRIFPALILVPTAAAILIPLLLSIVR
jgi:hypothetical protein